MEYHSNISLSDILMIRNHFYNGVLNRNKLTRKDIEIKRLYEILLTLEAEQAGLRYINSPKYHIMQNGKKQVCAVTSINGNYAYVEILEKPSNGNYNYMNKHSFCVELNELIKIEDSANG